MKKLWLNKENKKKCILFFNGWGMDEHAVSHLEIGDYNVIMFNDYSDLRFDFSEYESYDEIYLIAWSMGVFAASQTLKNSTLNFVKKVALNGTEKPMHDYFGIPVDIFVGTLNNWSTPNRVRFNTRVFGGRKAVSENSERLPKRDGNNQKAELEFLHQQIETNEVSKLSWDTVMIGTEDLIFPTQNQREYWYTMANTIDKDVPHFPFHKFATWQEIIDL